MGRADSVPRTTSALLCVLGASVALGAEVIIASVSAAAPCTAMALSFNVREEMAIIREDRKICCTPSIWLSVALPRVDTTTPMASLVLPVARLRVKLGAEPVDTDDEMMGTTRF